MAKFEAEELLALIEQRRVEHLHMVPIMFVRLLKLPRTSSAKYDLSSLKFVVHAAAPCPPPIKRAMIEWWGAGHHRVLRRRPRPAGGVLHSEEWLAHPGTVGKPSPESDVRVIDPDGNELPPRRSARWSARTGLADFTYTGRPEAPRQREGRADRARRHRLLRQGRVPLPVRPGQGHDHLGRGEHLSRRDRGRAA